jgi:hypothetical protein
MRNPHLQSAGDMQTSTMTRPQLERRSTRVPGGFDTESEMASESAPGENLYDNDASEDNLSSLLPERMDASAFLPRADQDSLIAGNNTLEEQEMHRKLTDFESSSLPEVSHIAPAQQVADEDDTFKFGTPNNNLAQRRKTAALEIKSELLDEQSHLRSPQTPPGAYKTPAPEEQLSRLKTEDDDKSPSGPHTSSLETMSSSPTAAAAARTVSRIQSMTTVGGYETADESRTPHSPTKSFYHNTTEDVDITPRKMENQSLQSENGTVVRLYGDGTSGSVEDLSQQSERMSKRPKYLKSRTSAQRLSYSSITSSNTDTASDATLGADFALQSGGALPEPRLQRKPKMTLSRSTSLGSMASGISSLSDEDAIRNKRAGAGTSDLSPLAEERPASSHRRFREDTPLTPKASTRSLAMPTDSVIANNVRDIEIPGTFVRQYRQQKRSMSPDKALAAMTPGTSRTAKGMTLKEHRSTVERLGKENFDLKMKIHFLDQALQMRSEDGVKEMITENVQLKSDRVRLEKDNHSLRKQVRELQKKLEENNAVSPDADQGYGTDEERSPTAEEEVIYLRERLETTEVEIEKLRAESLTRESEKRRLAEMVKSLGDTRAVGSDVGSREERDMWKDMLEAETIAREQTDEDNKKLREEIAKLRNESLGQSRSSLKKQRMPGSVVSRSSSSDGRNGVAGGPGVDQLEVERLRHEVSELQKMIGAQASTLTSRNKEKERLYQEIEDLKIGRMGGPGVRSVAGDSIFERSASRARSNSRASNGTRFSRVSDPEREGFETKIGELRDEVSTLKLENQNLKGQLDELVAELDAVDSQAQADADQFNEELQLLIVERDDALHAAEELDNAFQNLKAEAQEEIDGLGDELDAKIEECARLEEDLKAQEENVKALQNEMRSAAEGLVRLEEDSQQNRALYKNVQAELDDANRELENMEKNMTEAESKIQRLTVQQESSHNEIAFLREEQDGDKIKIGDLEGVLQSTHLNLNTERDKCKELERRLAEERHQREVIGSQEKQEVQRVINDLNREAGAAKDETRRTKKALSSKELEVSTLKERLMELEDGLREILGDSNATRSSLLSSVARMQRELSNTTVDLDATRRRLDEKETLLAKRDELLESSGLEYRKIADLLERERQGRRADKNSFEQALKSHQQSARALTANNTRIADLEAARQSDRRKLAQLETQLKDQLAERNAVLLTIWKRLSAMCGPDWAHSNSLINGNLPSQEVIGNMLFWPGFSRNLLLAAKQVEGVLVALKDRIKGVERSLWQEYQGLEHTLELRTKKLERIEEMFNNMKIAEAQAQSRRGSRPSSGKSPELQKLKGENRLLKAELSLLQQQHSNAQHSRRQSRSSIFSGSNDGASSLTNNGIPARGSSARHAAAATTSAAMAATLMRHHSTGIVEHLTSVTNSDQHSMRSNSISSRTSNTRGELMIAAPQNGNHPDAGGSSSEKWIHRLRELERRLKAEREARLLDRSGARKRLEERDAVNEELRMELERERMRRETDIDIQEANVAQEKSD